MRQETWQVDATKILTRVELASVLRDLRTKANNSENARLNLVLVRLACCCGLRVSEIAGLQIGDVHVNRDRPFLRIRAETSKGNRARCVPLWWDGDTLGDLSDWKEHRVREGAKPRDAFVGSLWKSRYGSRLSRHTLRRRFITACKVLGLERLQGLTIHHGRHTFISHALAGGRTIAEVRAAVGHQSLVTTSAYLHIAVDDNGEVGQLFRFES